MKIFGNRFSFDVNLFFFTGVDKAYDVQGCLDGWWWERMAAMSVQVGQIVGGGDSHFLFHCNVSGCRG